MAGVYEGGDGNKRGYAVDSLRRQSHRWRRRALLSTATQATAICCRLLIVNLSPPKAGRAVLRITNGEIREEKPLIVLICANCGFVRMHDEERLHD
jgi:hypothetical protein